jgi:hypothetical protein
MRARTTFAALAVILAAGGTVSAQTINQDAIFQASDAGPGDQFGHAVGATLGIAIVGSVLDDDNGNNAGAAYLFDVTTGQQTFKLLANDGAAAREGIRKGFRALCLSTDVALLRTALAAEITAAALGVLEDPRFAEVFGPGSRAEAALAGRVPSLAAAIDGRIDRLVITPDRVLIVDFKTRRPAPDRVEDVEPAYVLQLALYRAVLTALYPGRTVEAALVWTDGPRLMPVPAPLMEAAIAGLG